ncbi:UNVERIFIED_CONTAM: hypothetical protein FKN15_051253 [Acipenser sinensis]
MTFEVYKDDITMRLVEEACTILELSPDVVLKQFGEYFFEFCKRSGYDHMLRTLGGNLFEFIENLDALHSYLSLSYQASTVNPFNVYRFTQITLAADSQSIIGAVAKDFFNSEITMEIVNQMEEEERTGKKEHVVFLVTQKPAFSHKRRSKLSATPQYLANARRQSEKQLNKEDVDKAMNKIRNKNCHMSVCPVKKKHWDTVRGIVKLGKGQMVWMESLQCMLYLASPLLRSLHELEERQMHISDIAPHDVTRDLILLNQQRLAEMELSNQLERKKEELRILSKHLEEEKKKTEALLCAMLPKHVANQLKEGKRVEAGKLLRGFEPVYPEMLCIDLKTFCNAFPFHIVFDEEVRVKQAGVNIQKIVPGLQTVSIRLDQYFTIIHPEVTFTIPSVRKFINSQFILRTKRNMMPESWKSRPMLELRGQMVWMESLQCMLYLASPLLRSLHELEERQMHISDIAPHDVTRDLILLNQQRLAEMELSNQLERKKEELRILSKHLEEEKKKTEALLCAMLPKHVANQLKEGKRVEAGEFKECTVLFSDVVTFTDICSVCEPIQIVFMLNSMYLKFDRLTTVHDVYKVETIGDAYMVVGGVPIPVLSHAERVANFALGMIIAAREVTNPVTGNPIQIRVGLHTGPVLAGVVGEKMPRYCLFGDTVNTASRMESHGLPDKIHLSPSAYGALKDKGFECIDRGEIEVKGKGKMHTYFLAGNLTATDGEIMGRPVRESDSGRESAHSLHDSRMDTLQRQDPRG